MSCQWPRKKGKNYTIVVPFIPGCQNPHGSVLIAMAIWRRFRYGRPLSIWQHPIKRGDTVIALIDSGVCRSVNFGEANCRVNSGQTYFSFESFHRMAFRKASLLSHIEQKASDWPPCAARSTMAGAWWLPSTASNLEPAQEDPEQTGWTSAPK